MFSKVCRAENAGELLGQSQSMVTTGRIVGPISAGLLMQHVGLGIPFGVAGALPSHPQLLDWLASELIENGWRLKHVHRLIVNSATYRQSSRWSAEAGETDQRNRWLWRYAPRRLDAESLRDGIASESNDGAR